MFTNTPKNVDVVITKYKEKAAPTYHAFISGKQDFIDGKKIEDNPYFDVTLAIAWQAGWETEEADLYSIAPKGILF